MIRCCRIAAILLTPDEEGCHWLRDGGCRIGSGHDRDPTERTLAALGVADRIDATVCANDGIGVEPAPDMVLRFHAGGGDRRVGGRRRSARPQTR